MTAKRKKILIFSLSVIALTVLATTVRTFALINDLDPASGYYQRGAVLPIIFNIAAIIAVVAPIVALPILFKKNEPVIVSAGQACRSSALLAVAAFALLAWDKWTEFMAISDVYSGAKLILALASPILTVFILTFFVACCLGLEPSPLVAISGSISIIAIAVELANVYNDLTIAMNSPNKVIFQFACISAMLYILAELRVVFSASKPRFYLFSLAVAIFFLGASSLPSVIASALGIYENKLIKIDVAFLALFVFCLFRLIGIMTKEPELPLTDEEIASEGELYVDPAETVIPEEAEDHEEYEETEESEELESSETTEGSEKPEESEEPEQTKEPIEEEPQGQST